MQEIGQVYSRSHRVQRAIGYSPKSNDINARGIYFLVLTHRFNSPFAEKNAKNSHFGFMW
jgi:hypothetical protein